jgi:hypothetical protein
MLRQVGVGVALVVVSAALLGTACDEEGGQPQPTDTALPNAAETLPVETPTAAPDIRQEDLSQQPGLSEFLAGSGGEVAQDLISYVDLTEDGIEDAVVTVSSGGEGGSIAVFVYGYGPGGVEELLRVTPDAGSITAEVTEGLLATSEPVYGEGDPLCCPSQLRITTYRWDGEALAVFDDRIEEAENKPEP